MLALNALVLGFALSQPAVQPQRSLSTDGRAAIKSVSCTAVDDADDLGELSARIAEVKRGIVDAKCVVFRESLVPNQRLTMTAPPELVELLIKRDGKPTVLLGLAQGGSLQSHGVEATLTGPPNTINM